LPQQASGYHECASAGIAASIAATISNAIRIAETLICRSLSLRFVKPILDPDIPGALLRPNRIGKGDVPCSSSSRSWLARSRSEGLSTEALKAGIKH
jgi:hypothetical protein